MFSRIQARGLHIAGACWKNANAEGRFMMKLMTGTSKTKKAWYNPEMNSGRSSVPELYGLPRKGNAKLSTRRLAVLSNIFIEKITDLMSTGPLSGELSGKGFAITQVKVTSDATRVNVYWTASNLPPAEQLSQLAGKLRHELTQLRVCGNVPQISFVMDRHQVRADYVDQLLRSVTPAAPSDDFGFTRVEDTGKHDLPELSHNVLGLDRRSIVQKVIQARNKSEGKHQPQPLTRHPEGTADPERAVNFSKFLAQQKKQQLKAKGREWNPIPFDPVPRAIYDEEEEETDGQDYIDEDVR